MEVLLGILMVPVDLDIKVKLVVLLGIIVELVLLDIEAELVLRDIIHMQVAVGLGIVT